VFDVLRSGRRKQPRWSLLRRVYLLPAVVMAGTSLLRLYLTGHPASPAGLSLLEWDPARWKLGLAYVSSFATSSGSGPLILIPLLAVVFGGLRGQGLHALLLGLAWAGIVVLSGGDGRPFWGALVPVLPMFFLAVQAAVEELLDKRPRLELATWAVLGAGVVASLMVSRLPSDLGPFEIKAAHRAWMQPPLVMLRSYERELGRPGLVREIAEVERLRALGVFMRDRLDEEATVLTPWPGAIGYLSRKRVYDLLGRARPSRAEGQTFSWSGAPRVDLVAALEKEVDYVVPVVEPPETSGGAFHLLQTWLDRYDVVGITDERMQQLLVALARYELVSVPVPARSSEPEVPSTRPFLMLRRRDLGIAPRLSIERDGSSVAVYAHLEGHAQVADLEVLLTAASGAVTSLRPTGDFADVPGLRARKSVLLHPTGRRPMLLARFELPAGVRAHTVEARLRNPDSFDSEHVLEGRASLDVR
jgi:hypothetical protein